MDTKRTQVTVWTDGAAKGNPGPAGWAALVNGVLHSDWIGVTTNNYAELYAIYEALLRCPPGSKVVVCSDSKFAIGMIASNWRTQHDHLAGIVSAIKLTLKELNLELEFSKVKGHANDVNNIRVDKAASAQAKECKAWLGL